MRRLIIAVFVFCVVLTTNSTTFAQEQKILKGAIIDVYNTQDDGSRQNEKSFKVKLESGREIVAFGDPQKETFKIGDKILVQGISIPNGETQYYITDHVRTNGIFILFLLFIAIVVIVSRKSGIMSIFGMAYSFFVIFKFLLPQLYAGSNPILTTLISIALIAPVSFILSHGFNKKTTSALLATFIALAITSLLALIFINTTHLSGFGSEESYFLQLAQGTINIKAIFLAGIIIGTLGILDDATITQTAIVAQLKASTRGLNKWDIFSKAMSIGHDHIASTVNTLILVYTGASLPLLLLFINSSESFSTVLNGQTIAEEIVTMLVSSIGLVLSIPIATLCATHFITKHDADSHRHVH